MILKHKRGGKFVVKYSPQEMEVMHEYIRKLKNSKVKTVEDLLIHLFENQADFIVQSLAGEFDLMMQPAPLVDDRSIEDL